MNQSGSKTTFKLPEYSAALVFADGTYFLGYGLGATTEAVGEMCFNTSMTGYQEIITDPSYAGQIINFTTPHIGNTGINSEDAESKGIYASAVVMREKPSLPSNFRSEISLNDWLIEHKKPGIYGIDTRAITKFIRDKGAQNAILINSGAILENFEGKVASLASKAANHRSLNGLDLASEVTTDKPYTWKQKIWSLEDGYQNLDKAKFKVVAVDFGEKLNIARNLVECGLDVTIVPAKTTGDEILALKPDGVFFSNGPADPAATGEYATKTVSSIISAGVPVFGICLGFQIIALALGAKTRKMHQGHRGGNHPVKNLETGVVEITSQNHGFEVLTDTLPKNAKVTHVSLFDGTLEGFRLTDKPVFAVQYHPEASPGPHDSIYLFEQFLTMIEQSKKSSPLKQAAG